MHDDEVPIEIAKDEGPKPPPPPPEDDQEDDQEHQQAELAFGYGEHVYAPTAFVSFMVGNWRNESGPLPTCTIWYEPARGTWGGMLHSRARRARAYCSAANLPELFTQLGARLASDTLVWRAGR